ncbi:invasion protein [Nocardia sp. MDA0666]|uniref:DoxX family protein n=1 Tax=Nocardia sp. MDA0666 TaxID=2135448 RepID=UPI000D13CD34|nr:DoxX family protein [Nocardia sp. MDA0666]PSR70216.1 invasion protein [Nocardia sp. MDA0666]
MSIPTITLTVLLAAQFTVFGILKLAAAKQMRDRAAHVGMTVTTYRMIGALEVAGAAGLVIGTVWWPAGLAAGIGLVLLMVGAIATHLRVHDKLSAAAPAIVTFFLAVGYVALVLTVDR